ncbi:hypothetical protein [Uliginosibacterium aquaticum]|uniref:BACON domain-containing protein n=1 Tax=Uliginosibacterium aquaticum TaxID=2731212 RepID=A0ABX2IGI7_9RHOO|nr:hypothetical protein [Uliginosibacterium aquaticum]NSL53438.1 hypothetical protein [Uliginosibacterium aquaticum]
MAAGSSSAAACAGSASAATGDFSLSTTSVSLTGTAGSPLASSQTVTMTVSNPAATTVFITQTDAWLTITPNLAGGYATVTANASTLAAGFYCSIVNVALRNAAGATLSSRDVAVSFSVASGATAASSSSRASSASSSSLSVPASVSWNSYNGTLHPTADGALVLGSGSGSKFVLVGGSISDSLPASSSSSSASSTSSSAASSSSGTAYFMDYMSASGGTLSLDSSAVPLNRSLVRSSSALNTSPSYPRYMTFLTRVMPVSGVSYDVNTRLAEFELAFADSRVVLVLRGDASSSNVRLQTVEQGGSDVVAQIDMTQPHIFQIAVTLTSAYAGTVTVYVDGNSTPLLGPLSTTNMQRTYAVGQDYVQFGDNRNVAFRSNLDWMAWTTQGAYSPAQLAGKLPSGLGVTTGY